MRANKKLHISKLADYILSQDHERDNLIEAIENEFDKNSGKREIRLTIEESIWYSAMMLAYGRYEARKETTQLMKELF